MHGKSFMAGVGLTALLMAGAALAQTPLRDLRARNAAAHDVEVARQDLLAAQREITARQDQARTTLTLRELDAARVSPPGAAGIAPPPAVAPAQQAPAASFTAQMDRMERLTQDALARGNARIRAVRPASEQ